MSCLWSGPPGLTVGFRLLMYSVGCTMDSFPLFYLILYFDLYVLEDDTSIS